MVQFQYFFFISSIFVGFFKSSRFFCVTLYLRCTARITLNLCNQISATQQTSRIYQAIKAQKESSNMVVTATNQSLFSDKPVR